MKLSEYIEVLKAKLVELGVDPDVCMTESGYYAGGVFADLYEDPQLESIEVRYPWGTLPDGTYGRLPDCNETFLVLGHSHQSY